MIYLVLASFSANGTIGGTLGELLNATSIDEHGAVGNGTTDDTAAFAAALATGSHVFIPKNKTYRVVGQTSNGGLYAALELGEGQKIIGEDRLTSKIKVTGNGRGIQMANDSAVCNLTIQGNGISSGQTFNAGLVPYGVGMVIQDCVFTDFSGADNENGGAGVMAFGSTGILPDFKDGWQMRNCDFIGNVTGMVLADRAEYVTVSGCRFLRNTTGFVNYGGNNVFEGLNVMGNTTGMKLYTGSNDGHGTVANSRLNHNTTNLVIDGITIGMTFSGCHVYGTLSVVNSTGIKFIGCDLVGYGASFTTTGSTILIDGCRYPKTPNANAFTVTGGGSITEGTNLNF